MKHTPGPWNVYESDDGHEIRMGRANDSISYPSHCIVTYDHMIYPVDGEQYEEAEANARLIAAAPELLEALEGMVEAFYLTTSPPQEDTFYKAVQAISKAKGVNEDENTPQER